MSATVAIPSKIDENSPHIELEGEKHYYVFTQHWGLRTQRTWQNLIAEMGELQKLPIEEITDENEARHEEVLGLLIKLIVPSLTDKDIAPIPVGSRDDVVAGFLVILATSRGAISLATETESP